MPTVEVTDRALAAAQREAARRGTDVSEVVDEAIQRFVGGADLHRLLEEFRQHDADNLAALTEDEAQRTASEKLAEVRSPPPPTAEQWPTGQRRTTSHGRSPDQLST